MARILRILTVLVLLILPLVAVVSQHSNAQFGDTPTPTENFDPFATPTPTIDPAFLALTPTATIDYENTPEPTPFPTATPVISPEVFILLDARKDMELLADDQLGVGQRPAGWNGETSPFDSQIALLTRADLELLATTLINTETRSARWTGAFASTPYAVARDVRYDLEVLADLVYGANNRPAGWIGGDPLMRCNRATQTLVALLERGGIFRLDVPANNPNFCRDAELAASKFTETNLLSSSQVGNLFSDQIALLASHEVTTDLAVAFLDARATRRVGLIPRGTPITPIARSTAAFSNMMLVQGDNFVVFVEYINTSVNAQQFRALPNADASNVSTSCYADWCGSN